MVQQKLVAALLLLVALLVGAASAGGPDVAVTRQLAGLGAPARKLASSHDWLQGAAQAVLTSSSRHLMQADTCPAGYTPVPSGGTRTPRDNAPVQFSSLQAYGWGVPTTRQATYTGSSADFHSVVCNNYAAVYNNGTSCYKNGNNNDPDTPKGETHVRYECGTNGGPGTLWVLTYVYTAFGFSNGTGGMWAVHNCPGGLCTASSPKFLQYAGDATSGSCTGQGVCPSDCTGGACDWCCVDMYPIIDGGKWVGWMGKAHVTLPASSFESQSFMTHLDWSNDPASTSGTTGSTGARSRQDGLCLNCMGSSYTCSSSFTSGCGLNASPKPGSGSLSFASPPGFVDCCVGTCASYNCGVQEPINPPPTGLTTPANSSLCCEDALTPDIYSCQGFSCAPGTLPRSPLPTITSPPNNTLCCRPANCSRDFTCGAGFWPITPAPTGVVPNNTNCCQPVYNCSSSFPTGCGANASPKPGSSSLTFLGLPGFIDCCEGTCTSYSCPATTTPVSPMPTNLVQPGNDTTCCRAPNTTCPAGYTPVPSGGTRTPRDNAPVQFSSLQAYGWGVPTTRQATYTGSSADFHSVVCNNYAAVYNNGTSCYKNGNNNDPDTPKGETHVRYECGTNGGPGTLWVLTYVYTAFGFSNGTGGMWAVHNCPGGLCTASSPKFLQYAGDATSGSCTGQGVCPSDCTGGACDWCCVDMYPIIDGGKWVGWMGKAHVTLPASSFESQSFMTHLDWSNDPASTSGTTGSTGARSRQDGLCLNCMGSSYTCSSSFTSGCGLNASPKPGSGSLSFASPPGFVDCCVGTCASYNCGVQEPINPPPTGLTTPANSSLCCEDALTPDIYSCQGFSCAPGTLPRSPLPTITSPPNNTLCCRPANCSRDFTCGAGFWPITPAPTGVVPNNTNCCQPVYNCSSSFPTGCGANASPKPGSSSLTFLGLPGFIDCCEGTCTSYSCPATTTPVSPMPTNLVQPGNDTTCCRPTNCSTDWTCGAGFWPITPAPRGVVPNNTNCCQPVYNCSSSFPTGCGANASPKPGSSSLTFLGLPGFVDCCVGTCAGFNCGVLNPILPPPANLTTRANSSLCCEDALTPDIYSCQGFSCAPGTLPRSPLPTITSPPNNTLCCRPANCSRDFTCGAGFRPITPAPTGVVPNNTNCCQRVFNCSSSFPTGCGANASPKPGSSSLTFTSPPGFAACCAGTCTGFTCTSPSVAVTPTPTNLSTPGNSSVCCRTSFTCSGYRCSNGACLRSPLPTITSPPTDALCCTPPIPASGWFYKDSSFNCGNQGCSSTRTSTRTCSTSSVCSPAVTLTNTAPLPCCNVCGTSGQWLCKLPSLTGSATATYTWNIVASGNRFVGTCRVAITATRVTIDSCQLGAGWQATGANFYLGANNPSSCTASTWPAGRSYSWAPSLTGVLPVSTSFTRTASSRTLLSMFFTLGHI